MLTYPLEDWGSFYGPIGPHPTATLIAGLGHVRRTEADWDLIDLRWIDGHQACDRTLRAMEIRGFSASTAVWAKSAQVELDGELGRLLGQPQAHLAEKCSLCREAAGGPWRRRVLALPAARAAWGDGDPCWPLYEACESLATRSWQGSSTTGTTLSHEAVQAVSAQAHARGSPCRSGRRQLAFGRRRAGGVCLLLSDAPAMSTACGWASMASKTHEGAGTVLLARLIEDSFQRGDRIVDLGSEYLDCKRHWQTRLEPSYHVTHFRSSGPKAQALRLKRWLAGIRHRRGLAAS